jgi:hypothetical protein
MHFSTGDKDTINWRPPPPKLQFAGRPSVQGNESLGKETKMDGVKTKHFHHMVKYDYVELGAHNKT